MRLPVGCGVAFIRVPDGKETIKNNNERERERTQGKREVDRRGAKKEKRRGRKREPAQAPRKGDEKIRKEMENQEDKKRIREKEGRKFKKGVTYTPGIARSKRRFIEEDRGAQVPRPSFRMEICGGVGQADAGGKFLRKEDLGHQI